MSVYDCNRCFDLGCCECVGVELRWPDRYDEQAAFLDALPPAPPEPPAPPAAAMVPSFPHNPLAPTSAHVHPIFEYA